MKNGSIFYAPIPNTAVIPAQARTEFAGITQAA